VDVDPEAVRTCRRNCELNGVGDRALHLCGTIDQVAGGPFELVLANLYGDILLRVAERLVGSTRPGGALLLSGILHEDNYELARRCQELGCAVRRNRRLEEFTTILLRRRS
jgi:ribosomal protein L11 methyltransferase